MIVEAPISTVGETEDVLSIDHECGLATAPSFVGYDLRSLPARGRGSRLQEGRCRCRFFFFFFEALGGSPPPPPRTGDGAGYPVGTWKLDGSASALSFMLNGMLDFGDDDGISGFVGGGVGLRQGQATTRSPGFIERRASCSTTATAASPGRSSPGFASAISDNADVTLRYRFFNATVSVATPTRTGCRRRISARTRSSVASPAQLPVARSLRRPRRLRRRLPRRPRRLRLRRRLRRWCSATAGRSSSSSTGTSPTSPPEASTILSKRGHGLCQLRLGCGHDRRPRRPLGSGRLQHQLGHRRADAASRPT